MLRTLESILVALALAGCSASKTTAPTSAPTAPTRVEPERAATATITTEEVEYASPDGRAIAATLTTPSGAGKHPAVLMIAGSGPTDRDWGNPMMEGPAKSGRMLAEQLSRSGYVVLRYDKMGTGATPIPESMTFDGYRDEAGAGLTFLLSRGSVDPERVYVAGHSEGGLHALRLASHRSDDIAGVLLLSAPGTSMRSILSRQLRERLPAQGVPTDQAQAQVDLFDAHIGAFLAGEGGEPPEDMIPPLKMLAMQLTHPVSADLSQGLLPYDPSTAIAKLEDPVLIVNGGKDLQVDVDADAQALYDAATTAGVDATLAIAPDADHTLKYEDGDPEELAANPVMMAGRYNEEGRELDPEITRSILDWLETH